MRSLSGLNDNWELVTRPGKRKMPIVWIIPGVRAMENTRTFLWDKRNFPLYTGVGTKRGLTVCGYFSSDVLHIVVEFFENFFVWGEGETGVRGKKIIIIIIKKKEYFKEILVSASGATSCSRYPAGKTVLLLNILFQLIAYTFIDYLWKIFPLHTAVITQEFRDFSDSWFKKHAWIMPVDLLLQSNLKCFSSEVDLLFSKALKRADVR